MFLLTIYFPEKEIKVSRLWQSTLIISTDEKTPNILKTKSGSAEFVKKIYDDDNHLEEHEDKHGLEPRVPLHDCLKSGSATMWQKVYG